MLDPCPLGLAWLDQICPTWFAISFAPAPNAARGQAVCSADLVVTLSRVIDNVQQIFAAFGSRLRWHLSLHSLNPIGSNQAVKGSADRLVSVLGNIVDRAPLPLC